MKMNMKKKNTKGIGKKLGSIVRFILIAGYTVLIVRHSEEISRGARSAVMRCINVLIPSLFAFLAAADMLVRSGAYIYLSKPLIPLSRLLGLPDGLGAAFLLSNAAGYPAGASMTAAMFDKGELDGKSASRLLCICFNGGPAFFAGAVGSTVFGSARTGLIIWVSVLAANMVTAAVICRIFPIKLRPHEKDGSSGEKRPDLISEGVASAGRALFGICGTVILFGTFMTLAEIYGAGLSGLTGDNELMKTVSSFLEITRLSELSGRPYRLLPLICASGAFGGVCVLIQIKTIIGGRFSMLPFVTARIVCAGLSAAASIPLFRLLGDKAAPAAAQTSAGITRDGFFPVICLVMMIVLTVMRKGKAFDEKA